MASKKPVHGSLAKMFEYDNDKVWICVRISKSEIERFYKVDEVEVMPLRPEDPGVPNEDLQSTKIE